MVKVKTINTGVYGLTIELKGFNDGKWLYGAITNSDLKSGCDSSGEFYEAMNAIESLVLAHAQAGIDIMKPLYLEGIEVAVDTCVNNIEDLS